MSAPKLVFQISTPTEPCLVLWLKNLREDQDRLLILYVSDVKLSSSIVRDFDPSEGRLVVVVNRDAISLAVI
jgi:hypothetical protein